MPSNDYCRILERPDMADAEVNELRTRAILQAFIGERVGPSQRGEQSRAGKRDLLPLAD